MADATFSCGSTSDPGKGAFGLYRDNLSGDLTGEMKLHDTLMICRI